VAREVRAGWRAIAEAVRGKRVLKGRSALQDAVSTFGFWNSCEDLCVQVLASAEPAGVLQVLQDSVGTLGLTGVPRG
jgi:hypothetical protein